jgi:hypothetical protein
MSPYCSHANISHLVLRLNEKCIPNLMKLHITAAFLNQRHLLFLMRLSLACQRHIYRWCLTIVHWPRRVYRPKLNTATLLFQSTTIPECASLSTAGRFSSFAYNSTTGSCTVGVHSNELGCDCTPNSFIMLYSTVRDIPGMYRKYVRVWDCKDSKSGCNGCYIYSDIH